MNQLTAAWCVFLACVTELHPGAQPAVDVQPALKQLVERLAYPKPSQDERNARDYTRLTTAAFSQTGKFLVLGTEDGQVVVWDMLAAQWQTAVKGHEAPVKCIAFGDDDASALTAADDLQVRLWNLEAGKSVLSFQGAPLRHIYGVSLSPNASYAASGGFDGFGVLWDLRKNEKIADLFTYGFRFSPNGAIFATTPRHRKPGVSFFRLTESAEPQTLAENDHLTDMAFDPSGRLFVMSLHNYQQAAKLVLMKVDAWHKVWELDLQAISASQQEDSIASLAFSSDGSGLLVGLYSGRIVLVDVATSQTAGTWQFPGELNLLGANFVGASDGYLCATGIGEGSSVTTTLWRTGDTDPLWQMPGGVLLDDRRMLGAMITPNQDLLLFDGVSGKPLRQLRGFQGGNKWMAVGRVGPHTTR